MQFYTQPLVVVPSEGPRSQNLRRWGLAISVTNFPGKSLQGKLGSRSQGGGRWPIRSH